MYNHHPAVSFAESAVLGLASLKLSEHGLDWPTVIAGLAAAGTFLHGVAAVTRTAVDQYQSLRAGKAGPE